MNFQADEARAALQAASVLGLKSLPADLTNTLAELWGELNAAAAAGVEIAIRIAPGARLWIDDQPWDRPTSPTVAPGIHLIGATQTGHVPVWQWVTISPSTTRATLLPQAAAQLAPVAAQLGAGARGDRSQADAVRRSLGVDGLVLCTLTLVTSRYDARCTLHTGLSERTAVASFLPGEPLGAHAQRVWQLGLSAPLEVTISPGDAGRHPARQLGLGLDEHRARLERADGSGWSALQTQATYGQLRETLEPRSSRRRSAIGWATVCLDRGRDARLGGFCST